MLKFRAYQVIIHIAGWLLFMALPLLFLNGGENNLYSMLSSPFYWLFCFTYIFLFYFNAYLLIPKLFLKKHYAWYSIIALILLIGTYYLKPYDKLLRHLGRNSSMSQHQPPTEDNLSGHTMPGPPHGRINPSPDDHGPGGPSPMSKPVDSCDIPVHTPMNHQDMHHPGLPGSEPHGPQPRYPKPFDIISFFIFLMIMALSTAMKIMQQWQMTEQRAARAEADKASAELSFLKAQINPHFLFNTLNNIYTLAVMKDDHAPDSILKLSNIMRYVTDDAIEDYVPLQSEIDCINDYIELQRLRLGEKTKVELEISGEIDNKRIPPLVLMTFVENVFKYGVSKHHQSNIIIKLNGNDNGISFFCQNRIFPEKGEIRRQGIGLKNTQQRLDHLYPGKYILDINTDNQLYTVKLMLQTS